MKSLSDRAVHLRHSLRHPLVRAGGWLFWLGLALVLLAAGAAWPAWQEQRALADQLAATRRAVIEQRQTLELMRAVEQARIDVATLERKLSQTTAQALVVDNLARLAAAHDVEVVSQAYEESRGRAMFPALLVELVVQADHASLRGFLDELPSLPMLSEVQEASFQTAGQPGVVKGRLRIALFRQPSEGVRP